MVETALSRHAITQRGMKLEYFTIAWNSVEGIVAVAAGVVAGSISLVGFGVDSFIEVTSGAVLLWRMSTDSEATLWKKRLGSFPLWKYAGTEFLPRQRRSVPVRVQMRGGRGDSVQGDAKSVS
jgi:hypothetical protein